MFLKWDLKFESTNNIFMKRLERYLGHNDKDIFGFLPCI